MFTQSCLPRLPPPLESSETEQLNSRTRNDPEMAFNIERIRQLESELAELRTETAALRTETAALRTETAELRAEVDRWSALAKSLFNKIVLSPEACEHYKRFTRAQLTAALEKVDQEVIYVNCSFPASPSNTPTLKLLVHASNSSEWSISWKPNWSAEVLRNIASCVCVSMVKSASFVCNASQVLCGARKAGIPYSLMLKVSALEVDKRIR